MNRRVILQIVLVGVVLILGSSLANAQCGGAGGPTGLNRAPCVYSVKYLCGLQPPQPLPFPQEPPVKPANYATAVNIHNFHNQQSVTIAKKAVIANPENQPPGPIGQFRKVILEPDQALEIDCPDIVSLLPAGLNLPFIKGFVEIISPVQLSVTGVYTAQACEPGATNGCAPNAPVSLEVVPQAPFAGP